MTKNKQPEVMLDLPSGTRVHRVCIGSNLADEDLGEYVWLRWYDGRVGRRMLSHALRHLSDRLLNDAEWGSDE